jgi:hypothetical protein
MRAYARPFSFFLLGLYNGREGGGEGEREYNEENLVRSYRSLRHGYGLRAASGPNDGQETRREMTLALAKRGWDLDLGGGGREA